MEILYFFKPFGTKNYNNQVDYFLFLLEFSFEYNFFELLLIVNIFYVKFTTTIRKTSKKWFLDETAKRNKK